MKRRSEFCNAGSRLVEAVERGEGQAAMQYALESSKSLGMWSVEEGSHEEGIRFNNKATGEVMDLGRDGTVTRMNASLFQTPILEREGGGRDREKWRELRPLAPQVQYVGMGRMGAKLDVKAWKPEVETVSSADIRASLGLSTPDAGSASTATMSGSRGQGRKRHRGSNLGSHPKELVCPIGGQLMMDPVIAADGFSYEVMLSFAGIPSVQSSPALPCETPALPSSSPTVLFPAGSTVL